MITLHRTALVLGSLLVGLPAAAQLPVRPRPTSKPMTTPASSHVYFIDKFSVPVSAWPEFLERMRYNQRFLEALPGFIATEAYQQPDAAGNLAVISVATWENAAAVAQAKAAVQAEYQRIHFNPTEFYQRLHIVLERGEYQLLPK